jgi:hypothetical protein
MIDLTAVPLPRDSFAIREIGEETIFLSQEGDMIHVTNEVGSFIWNSLDGKHTLEHVLLLLQKEYEVSRERAEKDLLDFIDELVRKGLVRIDATSS